MDVDNQQLEQGEPPNLPRPHETLWYSDGSVVLATDLYLFKVHKSLLSRHSSVFNDMFESPNINDTETDEGNTGVSTQETYEGLPLVALASDEGEDVAHLLRAVYEPRYHDRSSANTPLQTVIALLLLSTKYDFKDLRGDVIYQISKQFPMEFSDFIMAGDYGAPLFGTTRVGCQLPLLFAAFRANAAVLLPTLYFVCSGFSTGRVLNIGIDVPPDCLRTLLIGRDMQRHCFIMLATYLVGRLRRGLRQGICSEENPCLKFKLHLKSGVLINMFFSTQSGFAIARSIITPICDVCGHYVGNEIDKWRKAMWEDVPRDFSMPEWSILREELVALTRS